MIKHILHKIKRTFLLSLTFICSLSAQEVVVSADINIRGDYSYYLLGQVGERYMLLQDKINEKIVTSYNEDMVKTFEGSLPVESNKSFILNAVGQDTVFQIIYGFKEKDSINFMLKSFNERVEMVDSIKLFSKDRKMNKMYKSIPSENEKKTLLYRKSDFNQLEMMVIDNIKKKIAWSNYFDIANVDIETDTREIALSNSGNVFIHFDSKNNRFERKKHRSYIFGFYPNSDDPQICELDFYDNLLVDSKLSFDNLNNNLIIAGLYGEDNPNSSSGYFSLTINQNKFIDDSNNVNSVKFDEAFVYDVTGGNQRSLEYLNNFQVKDIIHRVDGGFLLVLELVKKFSRQNYYRGYNSRGAGSYLPSAYVDYYHEDLLVFAVNPDKTEHWRTILFKKQFSQDDDGVFSSYFLYKSPSNLNFIFNDEVKRNNTISCYTLNPLGEYERRSILSTEYENLKLRFKDGIQISSNTFLVPSENSYVLNIIKIVL